MFPDARCLSYEGLTEDTAALLVHLGVRNADVIGWSDGGQLALRLAFTHPELVRRVVASGVGFGTVTFTPEMKTMLNDEKQFNAFVAEWFPEGHADYVRVSPDGPGHWTVYLQKARGMWSAPTWGITEPELAKINRPVLILAGDNDAAAAEEEVRIFRAIPKAQLCILPGTSHFTFQTRPDWLNPIILDFLDRD
jgi:pimeloyl-ACP methyl ester carboxylesterase